MIQKEIIKESLKELKRAKQKYPDDQWPWKNYQLTVFEMTALVVTEAGEALQAANKLYFNGKGSTKDIKAELIQTISTAIRVLERI